MFACGCRIAFDDVTRDGAVTGDTVTLDVLSGHDEDGDGIIDADDRCPMTPDVTNADGDGDGVGDICDSEPTLARQTWTYFSAMNEVIPLTVNPPDAWTMNADDYSFIDTGGQEQIRRAGMVGNIDVWIGFEVDQVNATGAQTAIIINSQNLPYFYGEIFDGGAGARLSITRYDGATYTSLASTPLGGSFPLGRTDIYLAARLAPASFTIGARGQSAMASTPNYIGDALLIFAFSKHSGRVRYLAIVESQ